VVDVAIINWNTARAALEAAESLLAAEGVDTQVKVVDNLSAEPERELLRERDELEGLEVILSDRNLGFGAAANLALSRGSADLVCVSNADAASSQSALRELAEVATNRPDAGMVGPVFQSRTHRYHAALPGATTLLARIFVGSAGTSAVPVPAPGEVIEVGQASGAFFVMRRQVWEELGGFDERFFLWYEDVDLAKRAVAAGRHNLVVGAARVAHTGAASFQQLDPRTAQAIRLDSLGSYIDKHHGRLMPLARPLLATSRALRARGEGAAGFRGLRAAPARR
jgi:N-acetylglucosaminyl-diphospho-decaprenol L-rhamnosyltransferase